MECGERAWIISENLSESRAYVWEISRGLLRKLYNSKSRGISGIRGVGVEESRGKDGLWLGRHTGRSSHGLVQGVLDVKGSLGRLDDGSAQGDVADGGAAPVDRATPSLLLEIPDAEVDHAEDGGQDKEKENDTEELVAGLTEEGPEPAVRDGVAGVRGVAREGRRRRGPRVSTLRGHYLFIRARFRVLQVEAPSLWLHHKR